MVGVVVGEREARGHLDTDTTHEEAEMAKKTRKEKEARRRARKARRARNVALAGDELEARRRSDSLLAALRDAGANLMVAWVARSSSEFHRAERCGLVAGWLDYDEYRAVGVRSFELLAEEGLVVRLLELTPEEIVAAREAHPNVMPCELYPALAVRGAPVRELRSFPAPEGTLADNWPEDEPTYDEALAVLTEFDEFAQGRPPEVLEKTEEGRSWMHTWAFAVRWLVENDLWREAGLEPEVVSDLVGS